MKKIIILVLTIFSVSLNAQEINWMSFNEALEAQKTTPKKIVMDAYTNWCGWCKKMDKETFKNADVIAYINENYYAVKFNAEGNEIVNLKGKTYTNNEYIPNKSGRNSPHKLAQAFGIKSFPNIVFLDEEANLISPIPGYKKPKELELYLKFFKSNDYQQITSKKEWTDYASNFKSEFKN